MKAAVISIRPNTTILKLSGEQIDRLLDISRNGRLGNGRHTPRTAPNGTPICDHCSRFYPKARLDIPGLTSPHLCCRCAATVEQHDHRNGNGCRIGNGIHREHLPVVTVPGRDDCSAGRKTRF